MQADFKELIRHDTCLHTETSTLGVLQDKIHQVAEKETQVHAWKIHCVQHTLILQASLGSSTSRLHWMRSPVARQYPLMKRLSRSPTLAFH